MNADRSKKTSRHTATKILALLMLGLASVGTTGCEHPLSAMFNQQGETARAAMEAQTELMQQILEDQRAQREELQARLDEADAEDDELTAEDEECLEETGEPCPDEDEDKDDDEEVDEDDIELALGDEEGEEDTGGIGVNEDSVD